MEEFTFLNTCKITVGALVLIFTGVLLAMNDKVALQLESLVAELTRMVSVRALRWLWWCWSWTWGYRNVAVFWCHFVVFLRWRQALWSRVASQRRRWKLWWRWTCEAWWVLFAWNGGAWSGPCTASTRTCGACQLTQSLWIEVQVRLHWWYHWNVHLPRRRWTFRCDALTEWRLIVIHLGGSSDGGSSKVETMVTKLLELFHSEVMVRSREERAMWN